MQWLGHGFEEQSRERVLTPNELRLIWNNLEDNDYGAIIKLVALTGQRPGEIAGLRWSQIHNGSIVLDGGDATGGTKNYRDHVIPLSEAARRIIAKRSRRDDRHQWCTLKRVFPARFGERQAISEGYLNSCSAM